MALTRLIFALAAAGVIALVQLGVPRLLAGVEPSLVDVAVGSAFAAVAVIVAARSRPMPAAAFGLAAVAWTASGLASTLPAQIADPVARAALLPHALLVAVVVLLPEGRLAGIRERLLAAFALAVGLMAATGAVRPILLSLGVIALAGGARRWRGAASAIQLVVGASLVTVDAGTLSGVLPQAVAANLIDVLVVAALAWIASLLDRERQLWLVVAPQAGEGSERDAFGARLAKALGVPHLEVAFVLDGAGHIDSAGRATEIPAEVTLVGSAALHPPVRVDPFLRSTLARLLQRMGQVAGLRHEQRAQAEQLAQSRRLLLRAADEERAALERRLRETVAARVDEIAEELGPVGDGELLERARSTRRQLVQLGEGIGVPGSVGQLEAALRRLAASTGITLDLQVKEAGFAPRALGVAWFTCTEGMVNAAKHATGAQVRVRISRRRVRVEDDGAGGAQPLGSGLQGLADRAADAGATLEITSGSDGTRLELRLPDYEIPLVDDEDTPDVAIVARSLAWPA